MYTIVGANGKERPTTLRDARKYGLVPSVTTILGLLDKPALTAWKVDQALLAALTLPRIEGESLDDFKKRAALDAKQQAIDAADEGTKIHGAIERFYATGDVDPEYVLVVGEVEKALLAHCGSQEWLPEKSFACDMGYGGKIDLHSEEYIVDFKSKEFGPDDKMAVYPDQGMQLAAYRYGTGHYNARLLTVYVSRSHPGEVRVIEHIEEGEKDTLFMRFIYLVLYWIATTGHDTRQKSGPS